MPFDLRVGALVLALTAATIVLVGAWPAWRAWTTRPIDGAGDSATAYSYLLWVTTGASPCPVGAGARYEDTLVREDGRWVFKARRLTRTAEYQPQ